MDFFTGIFALVIGGVSIWMSFRLIRLYLKVKGWNRVSATILSKEVVLNPKATTKARHQLKVQYAYQYNEIEYKGENVFMVELIGGWQSFMKSGAEKKLTELPSNPTIFVD